MESSLPVESEHQSLSCMADAQQLNNIATTYIQNGKYENAIATLQEALRLWEEHRVRQILSKSNVIWCDCRHCTLDGCIAFSEQQSNYLSSQSRQGISTNTGNNSTSGCGNKRRRISTHKSVAIEEGRNCEDSTTADYKRKNRRLSATPSSSTDDSNEGFIYQNPIRIPKRHNMGSTCFFIILFNLTLANHLKVLNGVETKKDEIQGVLNLYELIFEYWSRLQADSSAERGNETANNSLRFVMILFNNMSQVYKMVDNPIKSGQCLQNLLSIVMIAVEWNTRLASTRQNINDEDSNHFHETFQQSIDGFLTNVMPPQHCAEAA